MTATDRSASWGPAPAGSPSEAVRRAQRIIESGESEEAVTLAARSLQELEQDQVEKAMVDLDYASMAEW